MVGGLAIMVVGNGFNDGFRKPTGEPRRPPRWRGQSKVIAFVPTEDPVIISPIAPRCGSVPDRPPAMGASQCLATIQPQKLRPSAHGVRGPIAIRMALSGRRGRGGRARQKPTKSNGLAVGESYRPARSPKSRRPGIEAHVANPTLDAGH